MRGLPAFVPTVGFLPTIGFVFALTAAACGSESVPTAPNPSPAPSTPPPPAPLTVTSVQPPAPFAGTAVSVLGTGFVTGAQVRLGTVATVATVLLGTRIIVTVPMNGTGTVDVVVTNPNGESVTLPAALTYNTVTLSLSRTVFAPGDEMAVTWNAMATRCSLDWIGMYALGQPNTNYGPWDYTACGTTGTVRLTAPATKGQYEFRYLPDDEYFDVARSVTVTVE